MSLRKWRVVAGVSFPMGSNIGPDGTLPERLEFTSRLPEAERVDLPGVQVTLGGWQRDPAVAEWVEKGRELGSLIVDLEADHGLDVIDRAGPVLERLLDDLMFRLHDPLPIVFLEAIDVTEPVAVGEERDVVVFNENPLWKFSQSVPLGNIFTESTVRLREDMPGLPDKAQRALDWYIKALLMQFDVDRFMFMWVAVEILWNLRGEKITVPYMAPCQHEIPSCPECGRTTDRLVRGQSIQGFLVALGVAEADARALWRTRQFIHGEVSFGRTEVLELVRLLPVLQGAVVRALKPELGLGDETLPVVRMDGVMVGGTFGLGARRPVQTFDLP
jgi:hypothetical protein